ncbi:MAG: peptidase T [Flavobacteriales bacterium]|nr:peptidase T [Flavobacteriales bacterium]
MTDTAKNIAERFMRYVQIDTQSDPFSTSFPSTDKQKNLSKLLVEELKYIGLVDAQLDEHGYVFATIPGNSSKNNIETVCFCSHVDTAPDCSGKDVNPILHNNFDGNDMVLPDDTSQIISTQNHPYLKERIGDDIITASGKTLLGADDKAGVAIIMELANYLTQHPEIIHGNIRILFTPDEEVGRGVEKLDMKKLNADVGYTLDGGERGSLEGDTFSANAMTVTFRGISSHPGYAKGKMVNSMKVLAHFMSLLPTENLCPENTSGNQGFVHPTGIKGDLETSSVDFLIRDFTTANLEKHQQVLVGLAEQTMAKYRGAKYEFVVKEQYRNMREVLNKHPHIEANAVEAMQRAGVEPRQDLVRGGTDGSRLSFMGLPCPNIFTGEMGIHSKHEYVSVQDMEAAMKTLVELVQIYEEKA